MPEVINAILQLIKKPSIPWYATLVLVSGLIVFNPWGAADYLNMDKLSDEYQSAAGVMFVLFLCLTVIRAVPMILGPLKEKAVPRIRVRKIKRLYEALDDTEKAVIFFCFTNHTPTFYAPFSNQAVSELINKGIVDPTGIEGYGGQYHLFKIRSDFFENAKLIRGEILGRLKPRREKAIPVLQVLKRPY